jgi:small multidrug resistance pump
VCAICNSITIHKEKYQLTWSYVSLALAVAIGAVAQISLKEGATRSGPLQAMIIEPYVVGGLVAYGFAALFYIIAIRHIPLSVAFPSVSSSYIVVAIMAHLIWGEPFGRAQIAALVLIGSGIYLLAVKS